jgi:hypothetical protein
MFSGSKKKLLRTQGLSCDQLRGIWTKCPETSAAEFRFPEICYRRMLNFVTTTNSYVKLAKIVQAIKRSGKRPFENF